MCASVCNFSLNMGYLKMDSFSKMLMIYLRER